MEGMGLIFTPMLVRHLIGPLGLSGPITIALLGLIGVPNNPIRRYHPPPASHPPTPLYVQSMILQ